MAAYNSWNGIPMSIHPCLEEITRKQWGNNGIICTDGGALKLLIEAHKSFPSFAEGAAAVVKATTGQFLDAYVPYVKEALEKGLLHRSRHRQGYPREHLRRPQARLAGRGQLT